MTRGSHGRLEPDHAVAPRAPAAVRQARPERRQRVAFFPLHARRPPRLVCCASDCHGHPLPRPTLFYRQGITAATDFARWTRTALRAAAPLQAYLRSRARRLHGAERWPVFISPSRRRGNDRDMARSGLERGANGGSSSQSRSCRWAQQRRLCVGRDLCRAVGKDRTLPPTGRSESSPVESLL